ncbi:hypothetical protein GCM10009111_00990 [Colwellia asteriadis]|uniref:Uncharacterized protein n=1 Tax=Colwellia asteriadis TaxID=517723 RepID=A0ABP3WBC0_9GAMM
MRINNYTIGIASRNRAKWLELIRTQQLNAILTHLSENDTDIPLDKDNLPSASGMDISMSMRMKKALSGDKNKAQHNNGSE